MEFPKDLKYTSEHEWVRIEDGVATVGITDFAQGELGDIVYVEIETVGETVEKDDVFGSIEAVKTVSDLFMPISGKVIEFNANLENEPELINQSPYEDGWIIKVQVSDEAELDDLMNASYYEAFVGSEA